MTQRVQFFRDFRRFSGGHLKVWQYFNHVASSASLVPSVCFTPRSVWTPDNPWFTTAGPMPVTPCEGVDMFMLAGDDWRFVSSSETRPVINLIQGYRHLHKGTPLYDRLRRPAYRICVSPELRDAIAAEPGVNGPVFNIPNGIDSSDLPERISERTTDVFVGGSKAPALAAQVAHALRGLSVDVALDAMPRHQYLARLSRARVAVLLPKPREGFFLPPLEAMALGVAVVTCDCLGNRGFCIDGETARVVPFEPVALAQAARDSLTHPLDGRAMVARHSLAEERRRFFEVLAQVESPLS